MRINRLAIAVSTPLISGATVFGAIAIHHRGLDTPWGSKQVHAAAESSPEPEMLLANWPRQCAALQQALLKQPKLSSLTYEARPITPFVIPAWRLSWQGEVIALPLVEYSDVRVSRNEDDEFFVVLEDRQTQTRVMLNQLSQSPPIVDVFTTGLHPMLALVQLQGSPTTAAVAAPASNLAPVLGSTTKATSAKRSRSSDRGAEATMLAVPESADSASSNWDGPSLTEHLFGGPVLLEQLIDIGYRHRPQSLSCKAEAWERELPIAMGLALKLSSGNEPAAAYAKVGQQPGRVLLRQSAEKTTWQARFGKGESYADVIITLPNQHESVAVGFGIGEENWWDSEPRPEWLIALERAVEADTVYAWQALSVELHRAGIAVEGESSIQALTVE